MPPRIRTRGAKALKENVDVENKLQRNKVTKTARKVLGDKTNSLSDEDVIEEKQVPSILSLAVESKARPRRQRRLPTRFKENPVLKNLSTSQNNSTTQVKQQSAEIARNVTQNENSIEIIKKSTPEPLKKQRRNIKKKKDKENIDIAKPSQTKLKNAIVVIENSVNLKPYQTERKPLANANAKVPLTSKKIVESTKRKILLPKKHDVKNKSESPEVIASQSKTSDSSIVKDNEADISRNLNILQTSRTFTPPSRKTSSLSESLVKNRPKRIHRLPSRFDDHSMSPNKFISMQPCHASTPLNKKNQPSSKRAHNNNPTTINKSKDNSFKSPKSYLLKKTSPDTNNNPKRIRSVRLKAKTYASPIKTTPINTKPGKRLIDKSLSFKILDDNKKSKDKVDVYEFTYDPNDEPPPQKKKKKRVIRKKPPKSKTVVFKNNYDNNLSKAMAALKTVVSKKVPSKNPVNSKPQQAPIKTVVEQTIIEPNQPVQGQNENKVDENNKDIQTKNAVQNMQLQAKPQNLNSTTNLLKPHTSKQYKAINVVTNGETNVNKSTVNEIGTKSVCENVPSIRVEDIEADFDISYHDDINYSPVNSPRPLTPNPTSGTHNEDFRRETIQRAIHNKDPLNLQEDTSFFDDQPVASSSMNMSVRHPLASPWRVEFGSLPIKWQANTYLKPNMTPAVESSFISSEDSNKKKHVYVNMIPQSNDSLPQIVENNAPNLKQASIISFMREVAERNAKKKRGKSASPMKANTLFEDITNKTNANIAAKSTKSTSKKVCENSNENISKSSSNTSNDKENVRLTRKRKNENIVTKLPAKSPRKEKDTNVTYFGFDDSENQDRENILSKNVDKNRVRSLRSRSRVLQEFNGQNGPARAALPLAAKTKIAASSEAVQRMFDELKSGEDAPQLLIQDTQQNVGNTNVETVQNVDISDDEAESVHLFEDIDFVHHLKPTRKSYGKAKKVTFRQGSMSDSETNARDAGNVSPSTSYEDDLADLNFTLPKVSEKKTVNKKKSKKVRSKKEEKEANEWAAGFNSMCEDIEDFPLLVE